MVTNHLGNNHKISDLFRHLKIGQTECRKRSVLINGVQLYVSALGLKDGELLIIVSPVYNPKSVAEYALRWEIETLFSCLKGRGFNFEDTRLTHPNRVKKLVAVLAVSFCWCYLTGEWKNDEVKPIVLKNHGRLSKSLFRYGLDFIQLAIPQYLYMSKTENFINIINILRKKILDTQRVL